MNKVLISAGIVATVAVIGVIKRNSISRLIKRTQMKIVVREIEKSAKSK
jgi:hypothetical protein